MQPTRSRRRAVRLRPGRVIGIGTVLMCALAIGVWRGLPVARQAAGTITARLALGSAPLNLLLIANNARGVAADQPLGLGNAAGQADTIILAHIDPASHTIYAIPIPRDALIAQPGWNDLVPKIKTLFFMGDQESPPKGPPCSRLRCSA